ncbi:MAG: leucyl aminopeptidase family protein, partial [Leadbetterella sp.]
CEEMGFHALLAVGKGSKNADPCMVEIHYKHPEAKTKLGFVGKGVTFDTGGVSLKPGDNMNLMKYDMGGAAAVYGAIHAIAELNLPVEIHGICALTENCVDGDAIKPGDIIDSYAGKSIEVLNTDAEGRLILADALSYLIKTYHPDKIVDLATLTGNCIAALGHVAAGLMSKNDDLVKEIETASKIANEKVWRMPLWDDYKDQMNSDIADIKNLATSNYAGSITAAKFLEEFTENHTAWAHLDIAGVSFKPSEYSTLTSASGYGVDLLVEWAKMQ